jgi:hypothetical protein
MAKTACGGSLESGGRVCAGAFGRNLASVTVKMFSHLIYVLQKFYKFYIFNAISKDNVAIKYYLYNTKVFIPLKFKGLCCTNIHINVNDFNTVISLTSLSIAHCVVSKTG